LKLKLLEKTEYNLWENFIKSHKTADIFQSVYWADFKIASNSREKKYFIFAKFNIKNEIIGGALVFKMQLFKSLSFFYAPRGPINLSANELFEALKVLSKKEKAIFLRIDPKISASEGSQYEGFKISHSPQPENTLILDLNLSEDELLSQMKQKGRYNIKVALKNEVEVFKSEKPEEIRKFYDLLLETTSRDGFSGHPENYYQTMIKSLGKDKMASMYLAKYKGEIIAGLIATFYKDTAIYYYGASSNQYRNTMAPYLLQWTVIKEAKERGMKYYDFLGIAPENAKNHPWSGVTDFKLKFGGTRKNYFPAQEKPFNKAIYWLFKIYKKLRG